MIVWSEPGGLYCFLYIIHVGFMELVDLIWSILFRRQCFGSVGYEGCIIGFLLATFYNGLYRTKMRRQWRLKGSLSSDYCLHLFCHPCALCQQYRQLEHQGFIVIQGTLSAFTTNYTFIRGALYINSDTYIHVRTYIRTVCFWFLQGGREIRKDIDKIWLQCILKHLLGYKRCQDKQHSYKKNI